MEPANLNSSAPDDARLEALLRRPAPSLPDDGFSMRVVAVLPPREALASIPAKDPQRARLLVFFTGGLCGAVIALAGMLLKQGSSEELIASLVALQENAAVLADGRLALALGVALSSLLYVFWPVKRRRILRF